MPFKSVLCACIMQKRNQPITANNRDAIPGPLCVQSLKKSSSEVMSLISIYIKIGDDVL